MAEYRAANNLQVRKVTVNKLELLKKLEANLKLHATEYEEAVAEYKVAAKSVLKEKKLKLSAEFKQLDTSLEKEPVQLVFKEGLIFELEPPVSYVSSYEEVIELFKWETKDEVELDSNEVKRYIRNQWEWTAIFASSKSGYSKYLS